MALVGGLATLAAVQSRRLSLYAYVGMFLLMGIVKKNGIMIVDFALQRVSPRRGALGRRSTTPAWTVSGPIMMTTVAAIMGALPIALGFGAPTVKAAGRWAW